MKKELYAEATIVNATSAVILLIPIPAGKAVVAHIAVAAYNKTTGDSKAWKALIGAKEFNGAYSAIGAGASNPNTINDPGAAGFLLSAGIVGGNNLQVYVTTSITDPVQVVLSGYSIETP